MRESKSKVYTETKDLSYEKYKEYIKQHSKWFTLNTSYSDNIVCEKNEHKKN